MTVAEGHFLLYSYITPALKAGDYRFGASQSLGAQKGTDALDSGDLPVGAQDTHVRVTAPRYQLPPDQVLSTFPPAGTQGSYGSRLPQIVIKRRTLPWERGLTLPDGQGGQVAVDEKTPWLALVLIAEGEAELRLNQDVAQCVTKGVTLEGAPDVAKGNCLVVRQSVVEKILPSRKDVPMLAHAREVDIHDTELMMGDDDGFLAVVISNRLPVPGLDANGQEVPVKYLACLINLEGQFEHLIPEAPPHRDTIQFHGVLQDAYVSAAVYDHVVGGGLVEHWGDLAVNPSEVLGAQSVGMLAAPAGGPLDDAAPALDDAAPAGGPAALAGASVADALVVKSLGATTSAYVASAGYAATKKSDVYAEMAKDFEHSIFQLAEPEYTFPVLLHWSFTSTGNQTFESLMRGLDSGLQGSEPANPPRPPDTPRNPPLEIVETGHVGLTIRTRRGDTARAWYRGPLLPHPSSGERLPIAHASDQLRSVVPDGREDVSLAAAFEIGRLLALSRPAMVAALMRWRQDQFQTARFDSIWNQIKDQLPFEAVLDRASLRRGLEGGLRDLIVNDPDHMIGSYRSPVTPGDPVDWGANPYSLLGKGFGLEVDLGQELRDVGDLVRVKEVLGQMQPPVIRSIRVDRAPAPELVDHLQATLDTATEQLVSNVLANEIRVDPDLGAGVLRSPEVGDVVVGANDRGAITNLAGGVVGRGGLGVALPHDEAAPPEPGPRRSRRRRQPADPLDELLSRRDRPADPEPPAQEDPR